MIVTATVLLATLFLVPHALGVAPATAIVFPDGAHVVDITRPPYNATANDDQDDTDAFNKALADGVPLIYIPNGTYLISDTLRWGPREKRQVLQGQSESGSIIRLRDATPGFADPARPKAMIWTGTAPAQRFRNGIRNLTIDTGLGNPGAIGAQFIANNQGGIRHVTIRSGDPSGAGVIGLDLGYTDEQGPCLLRYLTVRGFRVGIFTKHAVDSVTLEFVTLEGQLEAGMVNEGQCVSLRGLTSRNAVPAYVNRAGPSLAALIDSELIWTGPGSGESAVVNDAALFARNLRTTGFARAIRNNAGHREGADGPVVEEFVSHSVLSNFPTPPRSLNLPIVETPEVPWDPPEKWVSVADFGPPTPVTLIRTRDGKKFERQNWAQALQRAIDSGATTVYFPRQQGDYGLYGPVHVRGNVHRIIGCEATLGHLVDSNQEKTDFQPELRPVFVIEDGAAPVVRIERFDSWYSAHRIEHKSKRILVLSSFSIYDLEGDEGCGDIFMEDMRCKQIVIRKSRLFGRQVNPEGWEEPRILNDGGQLWLLGLKTENPSTILITRNGGRSEIVGGFLYSNKNSEQPIRMFVNDDSSFSFTGGGSKTKKGRAFDVIVEETRDGETRKLPRERSYPRGEANMVPLYVGYPPAAKQGAARPAAPSGVTVEPRGASAVSVSWQADDGNPVDGWTVELLGDDKLIERVVWPPERRVALLDRGVRPSSSYVLRLAGFNAAGVGDPAEVPFNTPAISQPAAGTGLHAVYFNDPDFGNRKAERLDATIDFNWSAERPAQGMPAKGYSVRWSGTLMPRISERHTLILEAIGGARLWIGDQLVIDAWLKTDKREIAEVPLESGTPVDVRLEYVNRAGNGAVRLSWLSESQPREIIPASQLFPVVPKLPVVSIEPRAVAVSEADAPIEFTVRRTGPLDRAKDLSLSIIGDAVPRSDFTLEPSALRFQPGQAEAKFTLRPIPDDMPEPTRQAIVEIVPDAETLVEGSTFTLTLKDDDTPQQGGGTGLLATYFDEPDFTSPRATRLDPVIEFGWDKKKPHPDFADAAGYSVRWQGFIEPLFSEEYIFILDTGRNNAARLVIDGRTLVDLQMPKGRKRSPNEALDLSGKIRLDAGRRYPITIEYVQPRDYGSRVRLVWKSESQFEQVVPRTQLYPEKP